MFACRSGRRLTTRKEGGVREMDRSRVSERGRDRDGLLGVVEERERGTAFCSRHVETVKAISRYQGS